MSDPGGEEAEQHLHGAGVGVADGVVGGEAAPGEAHACSSMWSLPGRCCGGRRTPAAPVPEAGKGTACLAPRVAHQLVVLAVLRASVAHGHDAVGGGPARCRTVR
nr:unnamed protein product [Digitaria exilis]